MQLSIALSLSLARARERTTYHADEGGEHGILYCVPHGGGGGRGREGHGLEVGRQSATNGPTIRYAQQRNGARERVAEGL